MNKGAVISILGAILVVGLGILLMRGISGEDTWICQGGAWVKHGNPSAPMPTGTCKKGFSLPFISKAEEQPTANMANPASKNCLDKGGKLEIVKETAGEIGVCRFSDGSVCEEWKFFREECKKGQNTTLDSSHSFYGRVSKTKTGYAFKASDVTYELRLPTGFSKALKERLEIEAKSGELVTIVAAEEPLLSKKLILQKFLEK